MHVGKHLRCGACGALVHIVGRSPMDHAVREAAPLTTTANGQRRRLRRRLAAIAVVLFIPFSIWLGLRMHTTTAESARTDTTPIRSPAEVKESVPEQPTNTSPVNLSPEQSCSQEATYQRPPNGTPISEDVGTTGLGELTVDNGTDQDAVAILQDAATDVSARGIYVRSNTKVRMVDIEPGQYKLLYSFGYNWDENSEDFHVCPSYHEFGKTLTYTESKTQYTSISVTLNPVAFGNTRSRTISRDEFLRGHRLKPKYAPLN
jgi:hypothetical protein